MSNMGRVPAGHELDIQLLGEGEDQRVNSYCSLAPLLSDRECNVPKRRMDSMSRRVQRIT